MSDIRTIRSTDTELRECPVLEIAEDDEGYELIPCGTPLNLILTTDIVGDDYGSWPQYIIGFQCGHTIDEMLSSIRNEEHV